MCDNLLEEVTEEVLSRVSCGESFSAYEITRAIRDMYPHDRIVHAEVRGMVRAVMVTIPAYESVSVDDGLYTRYQPVGDELEPDAAPQAKDATDGYQDALGGSLFLDKDVVLFKGEQLTIHVEPGTKVKVCV